MSVSLKARDGYTADWGRGVVRVDYDMLDPAAVESAMPDSVEIIGCNGQSTYANRLPLFPSDEGKGIARLDDITRRNSGIKIGDIVEIRKVGYYKAEIVNVVRLEPFQQIDRFQLAEALDSVPIKIGDAVRLPLYGREPQFRILEIMPTSVIGKEAAIPASSTKFVMSDRAIL